MIDTAEHSSVRESSGISDPTSTSSFTTMKEIILLVNIGVVVMGNLADILVGLTAR